MNTKYQLDRSRYAESNLKACQESFGFEVPSVLLKKKNGKTRDVFSCVKFMFITLL